MKITRSFTIIELLIVIIIVGILASFAAPGFYGAKLEALKKEAFANLKLIQSAQKIYKLETGNYYAATAVSDINDNLKLYLNANNWTYETKATGCAQATGVSNTSLVYSLDITATADPAAVACP